MSPPPLPHRPPSWSSFAGRLRLSRVGDTVRPWLIATVWLVCAGLFKAALAQTPDAATDTREGSLTLVIPFSAGSGPDHVARTMARVWTERSGQAVEVRNLPDRQGYLAARQVATARPDGQVLLLTSSPLLERPARLVDDPFQPPTASVEDFTPIARVGQLPFVTVFPPGMFGRWLTPLSTPLPAPSTAAPSPASALRAAMPDPRFVSGAALADPPDRADFDALDTRDVAAWNALLAPRLPDGLAARLRADWGQVMSDPRVRLALAQSGTELWERIPQEALR
ncbi:tripartite tricarboxylate transporter substrate-binding protein [Mitsuaria sp. 7]|uniref:tripartite tricarboxylate transporter substrate-binding protein n=1 Tax=Mitsuaria sp. 7 TaxID=1658665 RepID=UPI000830143E|nr:tripartite tricarboxylate transporter substrate-binding protein [Mitsuaria sp. 7]